MMLSIVDGVLVCREGERRYPLVEVGTENAIDTSFFEPDAVPAFAPTSEAQARRFWEVLGGCAGRGGRIGG